MLAQEWMEEGGTPSSGVRFVDLPGLPVAQRGCSQGTPGYAMKGFKFSLIAGEGGVKAGECS